jgi:hypothetical protein
VYKTVPVNSPKEQDVAEGSENFTITQKKDHSYPGSLQVVITDKSTGKQKVIAGDPRKIKQQIKQEFGIDYNFGQQGVAEGLEDKVVFQGHTIGHIETDSDGDPVGIVYSNNPQSKRPFEIYGYEDVNQLKREMISQWNKRVPKGVAEGSGTTPKITFAQQTPGSWTRIDILVDGDVKFQAVKTMGPGHWTIHDQDGEVIGDGGNKTQLKASVLDYLSRQGVAEGVAETLPMDDAVKVLRQYGADHFKTTSNELHFYKQGRPFSVDLVMNPDATRSVTLSSLNSATRGLKGQGVAEGQEESCPHCGGAMFSEMIMNEKKDACYYKVKSRYKVWPSAYASGALVKCRKSGADSWGDGGKKNESSILEGIEQVDENLNKWFKEKWVRFGPDGKIRGDCARGDDSEGKPKCLPQSKAQNLGKEGRASAASRKRREDPNPERSGKAINVNTKKK